MYPKPAGLFLWLIFTRSCVRRTTVSTLFSRRARFIGVGNPFARAASDGTSRCSACLRVRASPRNKHRNVFTILVTRNYHKLRSFRAFPLPRCARLLCGCDKTNTLAWFSVRRDGIWTTSAIFVCVCVCFCCRCFCFLMKCRPIWMRTQWGMEWGASPSFPRFFLSSFFCLFLSLSSVDCNLS